MNLAFDPKEHRYTSGTRVVPSVTQIMTNSKMIDDAWFTEESRNRGTYVHMATQFLDEDDLDESSVDATYKPYLDAYRKFLDEVQPKWSAIEQWVFDEILWYAGTVDRVGVIFDKKVVLDIKTGVKMPWHECQIFAYKHALQIPGLKCYGLYLKKDKTYKLIEYTDKSALNIFKAALVIAHWKDQNGIS